jgi:hypothetical protein
MMISSASDDGDESGLGAGAGVSRASFAASSIV